MFASRIFPWFFSLHFALLVLFAFARERNNSRWIEEILNETTRNYDNRIIPLLSDCPLEVKLRLFLLNLADLQPTFSHFSTEVIMHTTWTDHRLRFDGEESDSYRIGGNAIDMIWTPDFLIGTEKGGQQSSVTIRNSFALVSPSGKIVISQRYFLKHFCPIDLFFFPFDEHNCEIQIMSYAYPNQWMNVRWLLENPVLTWKDTKVSGKFHLTNFEADREVADLEAFGTYDVLLLKVKLRRRDVAYVLRIYVPITVMVIMSWLCFLINYQSVPARTTMSAALVLIVITFIANVQRKLPQSSTVRLVDIYMLICFLYIFAGLVEYAILRSMVIKSMLQRSKGDLSEQASDSRPAGSSAVQCKQAALKIATIEEEVAENKHCLLTRRLYKVLAQQYDDYHVLDRISMVLFPVSFFLYFTCFFVYIKYGQQK